MFIKEFVFVFAVPSACTIISLDSLMAHSSKVGTVDPYMTYSFHWLLARGWIPDLDH